MVRRRGYRRRPESPPGSGLRGSDDREPDSCARRRRAYAGYRRRWRPHPRQPADSPAPQQAMRVIDYHHHGDDPAADHHHDLHHVHDDDHDHHLHHDHDHPADHHHDLQHHHHHHHHDHHHHQHHSPTTTKPT